MHHADTDHRWPAFVLASRPEPRRRRRGLLLATVAMTACTAAGLHSSVSRPEIQHPSDEPLGRQPFQLALVRMELPAPLPHLAAETGPLPTSRGSHVRPVAFPATTDEVGIPGTALAAYQRAAAEQGALTPLCHLPWTLLAAVGKVESDHADGGQFASDGTTLTPILGPELDGHGVDTMPDPATTVPGSPGWLRAVGPMQFLPATWKEWAVSARPGTDPDPNNVFDAAATAGAYLCDGQRDLSDPRQMSEAVLAYNHSNKYLFSVLSWVLRYSSTDQQPARYNRQLAPGVGRGAPTRVAEAKSTDPLVPTPAPPPVVPSPRPPEPPGTPAPARSTSQPSSALPPVPAPSATPSPSSPLSVTPRPPSPAEATPTPTGEATAHVQPRAVTRPSAGHLRCSQEA